MKYPSYPSHAYKAPTVGLVDAYIRLIATSENYHRKSIQKLPEGNTRRASLFIGRACFAAAMQDRWQIALGTLTGVREELQTSTDPREAGATPWRRQSLIEMTNLLEARDSVRLANSARKRLHNLGAGQLTALNRQIPTLKREGAHDSERDITDRIGDRGEIRTFLSLNRFMHPWFVVLPALPHHDKDPKSGYQRSNRSYDLALIESSPFTPEPLLHKLQVKSACFGLCSRGDDAKSLARRKDDFVKTRDRYAADITLISGCCDFPLGGEAGHKGIDVDRLLIKENDNAATMEQVLALDAVTNHLLLVATADDPQRQGSHSRPTDNHLPATIDLSAYLSRE